MRLAAAVASMIALCAACGKPVARVTIPANVAPLPPTSQDFADLSPGWRLRIVAAVTKSGKYLVETKPAEQHGTTSGIGLTLKASDDLIGFETAFWSIAARPGGGVSLQLASAELTVDGKPNPIAKPDRALIHAPKSARYIRIFYLTRKSDSDHNMAIAGSSRKDQLELFTKSFRESPVDACASYSKQRHYCEWIPAGMAVRPEVPKVVDGVVQWR